jgi:hypothetical protein
MKIHSVFILHPSSLKRNQPSARGDRYRFGAVGHIQLRQDRTDVILHGPLVDGQLRGNLFVRQTPRQQPQYVQLARRQRIRIRVLCGCHSVTSILGPDRPLMGNAEMTI